MAAEQKPALKMRFCIETNNILYPSACAPGEGAGGRARERLALTPACPPTHPTLSRPRAGEDKAAKKLLRRMQVQGQDRDGGMHCGGRHG